MIPSEKRVHFVYVSSDKLRTLEEEFSEGVSGELPGWESSSSILKTRPDAVNVTFFIYRRAHIMMSHGVADKNYLSRMDPKGGYEINKYHYVCVPGEWLKKKLLSTPGVELNADQIRIVGWPRLDALLKADKKRRDLPQDALPSKKRKVLWAPTHAGGSDRDYAISSYPGMLAYEDRLAREFQYTASLHPNLREGGKPTFEALVEADIVIADRGTMVYEAWALGKPVIFPSWLIGEGNRRYDLGSAEQHIFENNIGFHANSIDELIDMAESVEGIGSGVEEFIGSYISKDSLGKSYSLISEVVREVYQSGKMKIKPKVKI